MEGEARTSRVIKIGLMANTADASFLMLQTGGFQSQVNVAQAPGVEGDFCSFNPRFVFNAGPGGLVAGPNGCVVGRFAWASGAVDGDGAPSAVSTQFTGANVIAVGGTVPYGTVSQMPLGFVHREQQALITTFLSDSTMTVPQGYAVTLFTGGDFWVKNRGTTTAQLGQKAYANFADGSVSFGPSGAPSLGVSLTASIAPSLATFTASISGNILSVTALASGTLSPGMTLTGSGGGASVLVGTTITSQLTGSAVGGLGTYAINLPEQVVGSITMNGSAGLMTVSATLSGTVGVGQLLSGAGGGGVSAGTYVAGAGAVANTWYVYPSQTVTSTTITGQTNIETKWFAMSNGLAGELVKITSHPIG